MNPQRVNIKIAGMGAQIVLDFLGKPGREMWLSRNAIHDLERLAKEREQPKKDNSGDPPCGP